MIQKILRITDVGVVNTRSAVDLAPLTIIYGENGRGKTTLAAVLRSLTSSDPIYILERRRTAGNPEVAVLIDDGVASFSGAWTGPTPLVDVFDSRFISENIYSGPIVDHEHRRSPEFEWRG